MIQSLFRDNDAGERLAGHGQVIVDECHHVPAFPFELVLKTVKARMSCLDEKQIRLVQ